VSKNYILKGNAAPFLTAPFIYFYVTPPANSTLDIFINANTSFGAGTVVLAYNSFPDLDFPWGYVNSYYYKYVLFPNLGTNRHTSVQVPLQLWECF